MIATLGLVLGGDSIAALRGATVHPVAAPLPAASMEWPAQQMAVAPERPSVRPPVLGAPSSEAPATVKNDHDRVGSNEAAATIKNDGDGVGADSDVLIARALATRTIRSLDVLLFLPERSPRLPHDKAMVHCARTDVLGIAGWRLPTIGELNSLAQAKMLDRDVVYWSSTAADTFGEQHLALLGRNRQISARPDRWDGGRALCVRTRTASGAPVRGDEIGLRPPRQ